MQKCVRLDKVKSENQTGFKAKWQGLIPQLRPCQYYILNEISMGGDAPKEFIKWYRYGFANKANRKFWPAYLAKSAEKWYPNECITEHLLNQMGSLAGLRMAPSELRIANEQIRFLSRYFLKKDESLVHGAQIYATYLLDGGFEFMREVEEKKMESDLFPFQEAERAIRFTFPLEATQILQDLVKLLIFDAIIGNNDRHFYNWGVVTNIKGRTKPIFSPIFDTARGLLWNESESKVMDLSKNTARADLFLAKYTKNSVPKMRWEGEKSVNHFRFIELLYHTDGRFNHLCHQLITNDNLIAFKTLIDTDFKGLFSKERAALMKKTLEIRFATLLSVINKKSPV